MKKAFVTLAPDGSIIEEFGGDLVGICCGAESLKFQQALKRNGIELVLQNIQCGLPEPKIAEAQKNNLCIQRKGE